MLEMTLFKSIMDESMNQCAFWLINSKIRDKAWEMRNILDKKYPDNNGIYGVTLREGSFSFKVYKQTISLRFQLYNFREKKHYNLFKDKVSRIKNEFDKNTMTLFMSFNLISGDFVYTDRTNDVEALIYELFYNFSIKSNDEQSLYNSLILNYKLEKPSHTFVVLENSNIYKNLYNYYVTNGFDDYVKEMVDIITKIIIKAQRECYFQNDIWVHIHYTYTKRELESFDNTKTINNDEDWLGYGPKIIFFDESKYIN